MGWASPAWRLPAQGCLLLIISFVISPAGEEQGRLPGAQEGWQHPLLLTAGTQPLPTTNAKASFHSGNSFLAVFFSDTCFALFLLKAMVGGNTFKYLPPITVLD